MKRATGIGGIFFRSQDPKATMEWYARHLGLNIDPQYGTSFAWKRSEGDTPTGFTAWSAFAKDTGYFGPSGQEYMVNYRVADLAGLLASLEEEGVEIAKEIEETEYGKFAHVVDGDGRRIELWESDDDEYGKMTGGQTTF